MTYEITKDCLILLANEHNRKRLREIVTSCANRSWIDIEYEALEPVINNSDLEWIRPEEIGALTEAPILGICDRDDYGELIKVRGAWAYMDYAVRSFVTDLIETGKTTFTGS